LSIQLSEVDKFLIYHSNPLELGQQHVSDLQLLIQQYPYCQSLRILLAKASEGSSQFTHHIGIAAAFTSSRENLHHFIQHPEAFVTQINTDVEFVEAEEITDKDFGQAFGVDLNEMNMTEKKASVSENDVEDDFIEAEEVLASADVEESEIAEIEEPVSETVEEQELPEEIVAEITEVEEPVTQTIEEQEEEIQASAEVEEQELPEEMVEDISDVEEPVNEKVEKQEEGIFASADVEEQELVEEVVEDIAKVEEPVTETKEEQEEEIQVSADVEEQELPEEMVEDISDVEEPISETVEEQEEEIQASADVEEQELPEEMVEDISDVEEPISETVEEQEEEIHASSEIEVQELPEEMVEDISDVEEPVTETIEEQEEEIHASADVEEQELVEEKVGGEKPKDEFVFESPMQSDFFAFTQKEKQEESTNTLGLVNKDQDITQYNDDTMPYTFLWWLNKTRKEHASNARPFAANEPVKKSESPLDPIQDSLNNQIAENIFHLKGVEDVAVNFKRNVTVPSNFQNKGNNIIDKFIKEEPQIRAPAPNKVDTENKAKKSSEDTNEVVSETLAKIYVEQMLYHKALDVYKKLSLKFPEKSAYFASQIKYLELKVN
jgi:hypothetical protein